MIRDILKQESRRAQEATNLIASENYPSNAVREALASDFIGKYAEGYPTKRYYAGNQFSDELELAVQKLAQQAFETDYSVNVQAYSGSIANLAIYFGLIQKDDKIMGLDLPSGGHLTHGHNVSMTAYIYDSVPYSVDEKTHLLDYDAIEAQAIKERPQVIISGATAYSRTIDFKRMGEIATKVGAFHVADISHISGLIISGLHPTPFGHADAVMTTTHKMLRGPRGALIFARPELIQQIDKAIFPGIQGGPHLNTIAGIGVALEEALTPEYQQYCNQILKNSTTLANELKKLGFNIVTGGTDNHFMLIDLRDREIDGETAQAKLEAKHIIVNKNSIPFDTASPFKPSGIRLGTPAITTRGLIESDMIELARQISGII